MNNITNLTTIKAHISEFDHIPSQIFQYQSNGNILYMFGFEEIEKEHQIFIGDENEKTSKYIVYLGYVIKLSGEHTLDNFKKQVMDYFWGVDRENQYINEYNIAMNNLAPAGRSENYIANYKRFLEERVFVLDKLESDFKNSNIM